MDMTPLSLSLVLSDFDLDTLNWPSVYFYNPLIEIAFYITVLLFSIVKIVNCYL